MLKNTPYRLLSLPHLLLFLGYLLFAFAVSLRSARLPLEGDERLGLQTAAQHESPVHLLRDGADAQGSPAPALYLWIKALDPLRGTLDRWKISDQVFWRWCVLLPFGITFFFWILYSKITLSPWAALGGSLLFLLSWDSYFYASEVRPFGLWLAESVGLLIWSLKPSVKGPWVLLFVVTAMTATPSLFQILSIGAAVYLCDVLIVAAGDRRPVAYGLLMVALAISGYYALCTRHWEGFSELQRRYSILQFFLSYKWPILGSFLYTALAYHAKDKSLLRNALTILFWFLSGLPMYIALKYCGYFFTSRHCIYWTAANVFLILGLWRCVHQLAQTSRGWTLRIQQAAIGLVILMCIERLGIWMTLQNILFAN